MARGVNGGESVLFQAPTSRGARKVAETDLLQFDCYQRSRIFPILKEIENDDHFTSFGLNWQSRGFFRRMRMGLLRESEAISMPEYHLMYAKYLLVCSEDETQRRYALTKLDLAKQMLDQYKQEAKEVFSGRGRITPKQFWEKAPGSLTDRSPEAFSKMIEEAYEDIERMRRGDFKPEEVLDVFSLGSRDVGPELSQYLLHALEQRAPDMTAPEMMQYLKELAEVLRRERIMFESAQNLSSNLSKVSPKEAEQIRRLLHANNFTIENDEKCDVLSLLINRPYDIPTSYMRWSALDAAGKDSSAGFLRGYGCGSADTTHLPETPRQAQALARQKFFESAFFEKYDTSSRYHKRNINGEEALSRAVVVETPAAVMRELEQDLTQRGVVYKRGIIRESISHNKDRGTYRYYAEIAWGGMVDGNEICVYARAPLGTSRVYKDKSVSSFVKKSARSAGAPELNDWDLETRELHKRGLPVGLDKAVLRYHRQAHDFPQESRDLSNILGPDSCTHPRGEWVDAAPYPLSLPGMMLSCPDCRRSRIAFIPAHRLPKHGRFSQYRVFQPTSQNEDHEYMQKWRQRCALRGEAIPAAENFEELRRTESEAEMRRGAYAIMDGEIGSVLQESKAETAPRARNMRSALFGR